jgi:ComF family protein
VCDSFWKHLSEQSSGMCSIFSEAVGLDDSGSNEKALCRVCRMTAPPFARAVAHGLYQDELRAVPPWLKYDEIELIANRLGQLLALHVLAIEDIPCNLMVVLVPLFAAERRQRGLNQAEALARAAVKALSRARPEWRLTVATGVLERRRSIQSQAGLTSHRRRANVRSAFFVPAPEELKDGDLFLIDDIYTTGATAQACALALHRAGARSVYVAAMARAQRQEMIQLPTFPEKAVPLHVDVALWDAGFVPAAPGL